MASQEDERIRRSKGEHSKAAEDGSKRAETEAQPAAATSPAVQVNDKGKRWGLDADGKPTDDPKKIDPSSVQTWTTEQSLQQIRQGAGIEDQKPGVPTAAPAPKDAKAKKEEIPSEHLAPAETLKGDDAINHLRARERELDEQRNRYRRALEDIANGMPPTETAAETARRVLRQEAQSAAFHEQGTKADTRSKQSMTGPAHSQPVTDAKAHIDLPKDLNAKA